MSTSINSSSNLFFKDITQENNPSSDRKYRSKKTNKCNYNQQERHWKSNFLKLKDKDNLPQYLILKRINASIAIRKGIGNQIVLKWRIKRNLSQYLGL